MSNYGRKPSAKNKELDEVEELLRATEDEMLLKLSVNAHISRTSSSSSSPLDQDLVRRFEALKSPHVCNKTTSLPPAEKGKDGKGGDSDLSARFSALKAAGGGGGSSSIEPQVCPAKTDGEDEEDEVSKLIQWAMDAARLDPSLTDDEDNGGGSTSDDLEDDSDDGHKKKKRKPRDRQGDGR